jgi:hypothetical protein
MVCNLLMQVHQKVAHPLGGRQLARAVGEMGHDGVGNFSFGGNGIKLVLTLVGSADYLELVAVNGFFYHYGGNRNESFPVHRHHRHERGILEFGYDMGLDACIPGDIIRIILSVNSILYISRSFCFRLF